MNWDQLVTIGDFDDAFMLLNAPSPRIFEPAHNPAQARLIEARVTPM
jgi:hypothetical protein